jgi:CBS domain-containing protein
MKASDIMTREVVAVPPDAPVRDVAQLMVDHHISGVPVIEHGKLVGIISENDLLRRVEIGTEKRRSRWLQFLTSDDTLLAEYVQARGRQAREVMSADVVAVAPDAPIATVAEIMESRHIKRLPVVEGGKVVGIVSRANLVQALATVAPAPAEPARMDDAKIHDAICAEVEKIAWVPSPVMNNVTVHDGVVHLWGYVGSENERKALRIAAERVPGVKKVRDHRSDLLPKPS